MSLVLKKRIPLALFSILALSQINPLTVWAEGLKLEIQGSQIMAPLVEALSPLIQLRTEYIFVPRGNGASFGISEAFSGGVGMIGRPLTEQERKQGLMEHLVAYTATKVFLNTENSIQNLSKSDLVKIMGGKLKNWKELGGKDLPIKIYGPSKNRAVYSSLIDPLGIKEIGGNFDSNEIMGSILAKVTKDPGGIGWATMNQVDKFKSKKDGGRISVIKVEGVAADPKTIQDKSYLFSSTLSFVVAGKKTEFMKKIMEVVHSAEAKELITEEGYVPEQ
jgi:phosphate transport system substrate-binding protein